MTYGLISRSCLVKLSCGILPILKSKMSVQIGPNLVLIVLFTPFMRIPVETRYLVEILPEVYTHLPLGKKFLLKFKLLTIKDKKAQVVGKWKLDILGFLKKTDLITHSVKKGDSPKLNLNVIDVTELRKRGQIPSSLSFVENAGVQQIKKKTNFSGQLFRSKSHSSMSGDDELGSSPSQFGGLTKSNSRFSISTDQEGDYEISRQSNEEVFGENNSRSSFTDSLVDGCLKGNRDEGSVGDGGDGDSVTGNFCRSHSRSHSLGEESSVEEHQSHMKRSKKKSSNNVCHLGRGRISIGFERDDDGGTTARITTISRTLR
eukprot:TRINITY_DN10318_c0_g2_i4.p1 TRINITY_DN10318_c0_g2~~TRINITY_DN10318_c0_g2_i4.p1  ORF type:complete len:317 (+),score=42.78 TRINITY_DN10318_c0_g2_i4:156-1106(+)